MCSQLININTVSPCLSNCNHSTSENTCSVWVRLLPQQSVQEDNALAVSSVDYYLFSHQRNSDTAQILYTLCELHRICLHWTFRLFVDLLGNIYKTEKNHIFVSHLMSSLGNTKDLMTTCKILTDKDQWWCRQRAKNKTTGYSKTGGGRNKEQGKRQVNTEREVIGFNGND